MANKNVVAIELTVNDNGTVAIKQFSAETDKAFTKVSTSAKQVSKGHDDILSSITSLKTGYLAATAGIAIAIASLTQAWREAKLGAEFQEQRGYLDNLSRKYGTTAAEIVTAMGVAAQGVIPKSELMKAALSGVAKGLSPDQMIQLADAAATLGDIVEGGPTAALKSLTEALETGKVKGLKPYAGTTIDLKDAFGELESKLTAQERVQALFNLTIQATSAIQKELTGDINANADAMDRVDVAYANAWLNIKTGAADVFGALSKGFAETFLIQEQATESISEFGGAVDKTNESSKTLASTLIDKLLLAMKLATMEEKEAEEYLEKLKVAQEAETNALKAHTDKLVEAFPVRQKTNAEIKAEAQIRADAEAATKKHAAEVEAAEKRIGEAITREKTESEQHGKNAYDKSLERIFSEVEKYNAAGIEIVKIRAYVAMAMTNIDAAKDQEDKKLALEEVKRTLETTEKDMAAWTGYFKDLNDETVKSYGIAAELKQTGTRESIEAFYDDLEDRVIALNENLDHEKSLKARRLTMNQDLYKGMKGHGQDYYKYARQAAEEQAAEMERLLVDGSNTDEEIARKRADIARQLTEKIKALDIEKKTSSDSFFEGMIAGYEKDLLAQKTWGEKGKEVYDDINAAKTTIINKGVTAFLQGENAKEAIQRAAGDIIVNLAGKYATLAFDAAIEKTIGMIGAYIGEGAASSGAKASSGGAWAAVGEVAIYLGSAVAAMLGGKALAQQFRAEGGWIGDHPGGGWIQQGSGVRDDVYLGRTENTRHWGMGGEFVVNKKQTAIWADLLTAINDGNVNKVTDTGFAEGGWTGHKGQPLVGDPVDLALRMAVGGELSFAAAFGKALAGGSDIYGAIGSGIGETVVYIASAMGGALSGKLLGNAFKEEGGPIQDMGHFNWWSLIVPPGFPVPGGGISVGPGVMFEPDPTKVWEDTLEWIDQMWDEFLESQQAGWRNFAEVVLTPGDMSMDALTGLEHELGHFGQHLLNVSYNILRPPGVRFAGEGGYSAYNGLEYVPYDNFPIVAHKGERVQTASEVSGLMGEVRALREDLNLIGIALLQRANQTGRAIDSFTIDGAPAVRVSVQ